MPFAVRHNVAVHLQKMLEQNFIQPSNSSLASPVVIVQKKNGSLRFCMDHRNLKSVTKPDLSPLPRIDYMLEQLGEMKDLRLGLWVLASPHEQNVQREDSFWDTTGFV